MSSVLRPRQHSIGYMGDDFACTKQVTAHSQWRAGGEHQDAVMLRF